MYEQFIDWDEFDIRVTTEETGNVTLIFKVKDDITYTFNLDKSNCKTLAKLLMTARELAYKN